MPRPRNLDLEEVVYSVVNCLEKERVLGHTYDKVHDVMKRAERYLGLCPRTIKRYFKNVEEKLESKLSAGRKRTHTGKLLTGLDDNNSSLDQNSTNNNIAVTNENINFSDSASQDERTKSSLVKLLSAKHDKKEAPPIKLKHVDEFQQSAIKRMTLDQMMKGTFISVDFITKEAKIEFPDLKIGPTTMRKLVKSQGFTWHAKMKDVHLIERPDLVAWRNRYLRDIRYFRERGFTIYWVDETWINAQHTQNYQWFAPNGECTKVAQSIQAAPNRGSRYIVIDIGSKDGFLPGAGEVFQSKNTTDYHEEMDANRYEKWMEKVLGILTERGEEKAVIVMDNASYHSRVSEDSKAPTSKNKKSEMQSWLKSKGIPFDENLTKGELYTLIKATKGDKKYVVDEMVKDAGYEVLRIAPYLSELNVIEFLWGFTKGYVAQHNTKGTLSVVKELFDQAKILAEERNIWEKAENHVKKVENEIWKLDPFLRETVQQVRINLDDAESEDETEEPEPSESTSKTCTICTEKVEENSVSCDSCNAALHITCLPKRKQRVARVRQSGNQADMVLGRWFCDQCKLAQRVIMTGNIKCIVCGEEGIVSDCWVVCQGSGGNCFMSTHRVCQDPELQSGQKWLCSFCS